MIDDCFIVVGVTYPFSPSLWPTKRAAQRALKRMAKAIRDGGYTSYDLARNGLAVERRTLRDMDRAYAVYEPLQSDGAYRERARPFQVRP